MRKKRRLAIKKLVKRLYKKKFSTKQGYLDFHRKNAHLRRRLIVMTHQAEGRPVPPNFEKRRKKLASKIDANLEVNDFSSALSHVSSMIELWGGQVSHLSDSKGSASHEYGLRIS